MKLTVSRDGKLEYLRAPVLEKRGVVHGFSTRFGGVSEGHLESLNLGVHRGDVFENVVENYRIFGNAVGFAPEDTVFPCQRHTDTVRKVGFSDRGTGLFREQTDVCDGLITNEPNVALLAFSADCTPVLLFDRVHRAIGAVHAGWRGTAQGIVKKAVEAMHDAYGSEPADICAAIGPCIGKCCFETDGDVPDAMRASLGADAESAIRENGTKFFVDLKLLNRIWLEKAGVKDIDVAEECTACEPNRFWSHRIVGDARGTLAAVIMLQKETDA